MASRAISGDVPVLESQQLSKTHEPGGEFPNRHVPGAKEYYPLTEPAAGTALLAVRNCKMLNFDLIHIDADIDTG